MKVAVLGAGSWGIALANVCAELNYDVSMWEYRSHVAELMSQTRENNDALTGVHILSSITITSDLEQTLHDAALVLLVVPSHTMRDVATQIAQIGLLSDPIVTSCTKGIENNTLLRMSQVFFQVIPQFPQDNFVVLSGPSHAEEVSRHVPTAIVAASQNEKVANKVQRSLMTKSLRIYRSTDIIGVELGGSLKNVIAIAAGICDGAGFGDNTKAALQPRGLSEMARLGKKLGAEFVTFAGLSGMGDLIVTCMSRHSRNRYVGEQVGKGIPLQVVLDKMKMVAEGVKTTRSAWELAKKTSVEMPITEQVYKILFENKDPSKAVQELLLREAKPEVWE